MARGYGTAQGVTLTLEVLGWLSVMISAVVIASALFNQGRAGAEFFTGVSLAFGGLMWVAMAQVVRAVVDTAENTSELVELMRARERQATGPSQAPVPSPWPTSGGQPARTVGQRVKVYKGREIMREAEGVSVHGRVFESVLDAEAYIRGLKMSE